MKVGETMTDQDVFELGQLYAELFLIRRLINDGAGIRQRLLPQNDCEALDGIAQAADAVIRKLMRQIDEHKYAQKPPTSHEQLKLEEEKEQLLDGLRELHDFSATLINRNARDRSEKARQQAAELLKQHGSRGG